MPPTALAAATRIMHDLRAAILGDVATESIGLDRITGRVLAAPVNAPRPVPAGARATMDGFVVEAADDPPLSVVGDRVDPGDDAPTHEPGTARRVATGAPLPRGADAVIPVEEATVIDGTLSGVPVEPGTHVVEEGSVVAAGETVLEAGRRLAPRDAAILRELGRDEVTVRRRLSTAILPTGTEIHEGREPDRDSDVIANLVRTWGGDPTLAGSEPDDPDRLGERLTSLAADHDVVVTTGGTGASLVDETSGVLGAESEVRIDDLAVRPGSNSTIAWLAEKRTVLASLPGPPGAAFGSAVTLVRPLFVGPSPRPTVNATMTVDLSVPDHPVSFLVPVEFSAGGDDDGDARVVPFGHPDSSVSLYGDRYRPHRVASCAHLSVADGSVVTDTDLQAGESVAVVPYEVVES